MILILLVLACLYVAFVLWVTFANEPRVHRLSNVERSGCLAFGFGLPLIVGGVIAGLVSSSPARPIGWAAAAAGVLGIVAAMVAAVRNAPSTGSAGKATSPGAAQGTVAATAPATAAPPSPAPPEVPAPPRPDQPADNPSDNPSDSPPDQPSGRPARPPLTRPGPRDWVQTDPSVTWMRPYGPSTAPSDLPPLDPRPAAATRVRAAPATAARTGCGGLAAVAGLAVVVVLVVIAATGFIADALTDSRREKRQKSEQAFRAAPVPQITVGTAPAEPARLSLPTIKKVDVAEPEQWPRACSLVTDDEVRAVLPQATQFRREGKANEMRFVTKTYHPSPYGGGLGPPTEKHRAFTVPEQACDIHFQLPHKYQDRPTHGGVASLTVEVKAMGHPRAVAGFAFLSDPKFKKFVDRNRAGFCSGTPNRITCTKKQLTLTLTGNIQYLTTPILSEDDVPILRFAGQPVDVTADYYDQKVVLEIMGLMLRKIPTRTR